MGCVITFWLALAGVIISLIVYSWNKIVAFFKKPYRLIIAIILVIVIVAFCAWALYTSEQNSQGKKRCKNCGSTENISDVTGYCPICDEGFWEWQKDYYDK